MEILIPHIVEPVAVSIYGTVLQAEHYFSGSGYIHTYKKKNNYLIATLQKKNRSGYNQLAQLLKYSTKNDIRIILSGITCVKRDL
jgi:hypothetical protein